MADPILPGINVSVVGSDGRCTQPWYLFFRRVEQALKPGSDGSLAVALSVVQTTVAETVATVETVATAQEEIQGTVSELDGRVTLLEP